MNLILLDTDDFPVSQTHAVIKGRRMKHIREVHRAKPGDTLCVGLVNGCMGNGRIVHMSDTVIEMEVLLDIRPPKVPETKLILALPRPKVLSRVLITAASMGIKEIFLINAYRVEKSYWESPRVSDDAVYKALVLGLEQAKDTIFPTVIKKKRFKPFVEDELPDIIRNTIAYVAHPDGDTPCPRGVTSPLSLAIGPEGGFIPYEVEKLQACGFSKVHFGDRILRVEAAVPALLGRLL